MDQPEPTTETVKASEARQNFSSLLNEVFRGEKRVIVEKSGVPVAAIVSPTDFNRLGRYERRRRDRFKLLEEFSQAFRDVPDAEVEREVAQAVQEARREQRRADEERAELAAVLKKMREPFKDVPPEELEQEVAKALEEVRRERRDQTRRSA